MTITDLEPKLVFGIFDEITKVPRPSKKEIDMATAGEQQVTDEDINLKGDKSDEQKNS